MALRTPLSVTPHLYMGDSTGRPLDMGTVYFGEPDKDPEFYPINLFSDDELTLPLAQPVHTKGGYLYDKGDMVEPHAKELIYSVKVLDSYGRKVFYKGAMMRNSWNDDVVEQINAALVSTAEQSAQIATDVAKDIADKAVISSGFITVDSFELGATLTQRNEALRHTADGKLYRWAGDLPKVVPASSTPASSGGLGSNAWLEVSDVTFRQDLASPNGFKSVGGLTNFTDNIYVSATSHDEIQAAQNTYKDTGKTIVYTSPLTINQKLNIHCSTVFASDIHIKNMIEVVSEERIPIVLDGVVGLQEFSDVVPQFAAYEGQVIRITSDQRLVERWNGGLSQEYTKNTSFLMLEGGQITPSLDMSFSDLTGVTATTSNLVDLLPLNIDFKGTVTHEGYSSFIRIARSKTTLNGAGVGFKAIGAETSVSVVADFVTVNNVRTDLFTTVGAGYGISIANCYGTLVKNCVSPHSSSTIDGRHGASTTIENCVSGKIGTHWGNNFKTNNCTARYIHYAGKDLDIVGGSLTGDLGYGDNSFCVTHRNDTPVTMGRLLIDGVKIGSKARILGKFILLNDDPATARRRIFDTIEVKNIDTNNLKTVCAIGDVTSIAKFGNSCTVNLHSSTVRQCNPLMNIANDAVLNIPMHIRMTGLTDLTGGGALWVQFIYGGGTIVCKDIDSKGVGQGVYFQLNGAVKTEIVRAKVASMLVRGTNGSATVEMKDCSVSLNSITMPRAWTDPEIKLKLGLQACDINYVAANSLLEIEYAIMNKLTGIAMPIDHTAYFSEKYIQAPTTEPTTEPTTP